MPRRSRDQPAAGRLLDNHRHGRNDHDDAPRPEGRPDARGWRGVDEGWGRRAVDFATLSELANCREYVALRQQLGVGVR